MQTNTLSQSDISNRGPVVAQAAAFSTTRRADLTITADIVTRMARDMADVMRYSAERVVRDTDLVLKGWTRTQISRHCNAAAAKAQDIVMSLQNPNSNSVETQDEAHRKSLSPQAALAGGSFFENTSLGTLLKRNEEAAVRVESLIAQMQNEMSEFKSLNASIQSAIQNLEVAHAQ